MKFQEVFCNSFKAIREQLHAEVKQQVDFILPSMPMVNACRADEFDFFKPLLDSGDLTVDQMHHACDRYFLGKTKTDTPMFWMIDEMFQPRDAHIGDKWISNYLKQREPLLDSWQVTHCLFGLHLLAHTDTTDSTDIKCPAETAEMAEIKFSKSQILDKIDSCALNSFRDFCVTNKPVCVVESEQSAVILSEILPESIWMAYATLSNLTPELFAPLQGRTVTIYPRTDPSMSTYLFFCDYAELVRRSYPTIDLSIDQTLEDKATDEQKQRCIDLLGFLMESPTNL